MCEQVYGWFLRLYPARFQEAYRDEALQLFRDRARDETGFLSSLRLWIDLLNDLAVSIPGSYRTVAAAAATAHDGTPLFLSLENEALNFSSLFYGVIASVMIYAVVLILASHAGTSLPIRYSSVPQPTNYSGAATGSSSAADAEVPKGSGAIGKPAPRVGISYTPFPPTSGSTVNITAKVFGFDGRPTPSGSVSFFDGDALVGTGELNNGATTVTGRLPELAEHFLRAVYAGDSNYSASASSNPEQELPLAQSGAPGGASHGTVKPLTFEVVSIHEDKSGASMRNLQNGPTPDGYRLRSGPLLAVIQAAFVPSEGTMSFRPNRISGLPPWAHSTLYDIDAKIYESDLASWRDPALQPAMLRSMLQAMLADRFKLSVHRETKVVPIYELEVGKKRPKLKPYDGATLAEIQQKHPGARMLSGGGPIAAPGPNPGEQSFFGVTTSQLGTILSNLAGRPVVDKSGLTGKYDVSYQIELRPPPKEDGTPAPVPPDFFSSQISTIVQDQLGLKLKAGTGPVEMLVIDRVDQPSEN